MKTATISPLMHSCCEVALRMVCCVGLFLSIHAAAQAPAKAAVSCGKGKTQCGGVCSDIDFDSNNCGKCDRACAIGETCSQGSCIKSTKGNCKFGQMICSGRCVDINKDAKNCGACNNVCGDGQICSLTFCEAKARRGTPKTQAASAPGSPTSCGPAQSWCRGSCTDDFQFLNDSHNCGRCGNMCAFNESCSGGVCSCAPGTTSCGGGCLSPGSLMSDNNNCGSCGNMCSFGLSCLGGTCTRTGPCMPGDLSCNAAALNLTDKPDKSKETGSQ